MTAWGKMSSSAFSRNLLCCFRLSKIPTRCFKNQSQPVKLSRKIWNPNLRHITKKTGNKRQSLTPVDKVEPSLRRSYSSLVKPFFFTAAVSGGSYVGAVIWQYESLRSHFQQVQQNINDAFQEQFYGKAGGFRHQINSWWNSLSPGRKVVAGIVGVNIAVFGMWKLRPLQGLMVKYFSSSPFSGAPCISMVLSVFSHYSLFHIGANMFVLWSFSAPITDFLGREQFLGFFLTAGVISGFTSYMYKVATASLVPSIGASGAILAILGMVCCQYPEARLSIAFVDYLIPHSFSADTAMKSLIALDVVGIVFGWRLFDHAAHLGGMLFGIWYQKYGKDIVWRKYREPVMKVWHDLRGKP